MPLSVEKSHQSSLIQSSTAFKKQASFAKYLDEANEISTVVGGFYNEERMKDCRTLTSSSTFASSSVTQSQYTQARAYISEQMQNVINSLQEQGIDTEDLKSLKQSFEEFETQRAELKTKIIQNANALLQNASNADKISLELKENLSLYNPSVNFDYAGDFFSLVLEHLPNETKENIANAIATIKQFQRDEAGVGIELGDGKKLTWNEYSFSINDGQNVLLSAFIKAKNDTMKTLLEIFDERTQDSKPNINTEKLLQEL